MLVMVVMLVVVIVVDEGLLVMVSGNGSCDGGG